MKSISILFGFLLIAALGYGAWLIVINFYQAMKDSDPEVVAAVIGAMTTILAGTAAIIFNQRNERQRASEEAHRLKKVEIYQNFVETVASLLGASNTNLSIVGPSEQELTKFVFELKSKILLWGSPEVIKAYIDFEKISGNPSRSLKSANKLYAAIRQDLGLSNKGLNNHELVKLYIKQEDHQNV